MRPLSDLMLAQEAPSSTTEKIAVKNTQWITPDGKIYSAIGDTMKKIPPGLYGPTSSRQTGEPQLVRMNLVANELIELPDSVSKEIVSEIKKFWSLSDVYSKYGIMHKRGILMYGPPGGGKTAAIQLLISDVIERGGIVIKYGMPEITASVLRVFREIEPKKPLIVIMEDIDSIIDEWCESDVLNLIDGVDRVDGVVFIATTNYPEKLGDRIINRPSRFDKRFFVGFPSEKSRHAFLKSIVRDTKIDIKKWVKDTEGFSIAHLKELFTSVVLIGDKYEKALETLRAMKEEKASAEGEKESLGL